MALQYDRIPTEKQWRADSSVSLALRANDRVLTRIDALVALFNTNPPLRYATLPDLYFAVDYWLKMQPGDAGLEKGRRPAMTALHAVAARDLCYMLDCTINSLPRELELMFGREVGRHGNKIDHEDKRANFLTPTELRRYEILWKGGKAYQLNWWETGRRDRIVLTDSKHAAFERNRISAGYAGFVMSMSRTFYMAEHSLGDNNMRNGVFHSSYLDGNPVSAAGTILIEQGVVKGIRADSGHYTPGDVNMLQALQAFQMLGVNIGKVSVTNFRGDVTVPAPDFMANTTSRQAFKDQRSATLQKNSDAFDNKPGRGDLSKMPTAAARRAGWTSPPPGYVGDVNPAAFRSPKI